MPFSGNGKFLSQLLEKAAPVETDNLMVSDGDDLKKSTLKNILEKVSFSTLKTTAKNIIGAINELNTNITIIDPLSAKYLTNNDIDSEIDGHAGQYAVVFGHSEKLNGKLGYMVFVATFSSAGKFAQIAVGQNGGIATRFYGSSGWTEWK